MEKQITYKHVFWSWVIAIAIMAIVFMADNQDYADTHEWFVNHSEIIK